MSAAPSRHALAEAQLCDDMADFAHDPLGFVLYAYPWDTDPSLQVVELPEPWASRYDSKYGPDAWACEFLDRLGEEVRARGFDPSQPVAVDPVQASTTSGHGIGKSAMTGWLTNWIMSTRPFSQGTVTANTGTQLQTKTWAQIAKWTRKCITAHWFSVSTGKGSLSIRHKQHPESWFCTGQTCRKENSEAFAGQHAANSTSWYIFDEASNIPNEIWEVASGGLTDGEPMFFAFGNPTRNSGAFYQTFHKQRHRWINYRIDSRSVQITNKDYLQQLVDDYGEDSDMVRVRVKGQFPRASSLQLIPSDRVTAAQQRDPGHHAHQPLICGVDVAREGGDKSVVRIRRGLDARSFPVLKIQETDGPELASRIAALDAEFRQTYGHGFDAIFVDATGGWGWSLIDALRTNHNLNPTPINFAMKAADAQYANKRAEMWFEMGKWLKEGGAIPVDDELEEELTSVEYGHTRGADQLILERKEDLKKRIGVSPDNADALALTFAEYVAPRVPGQDTAGTQSARRDYDPLA